MTSFCNILPPLAADGIHGIYEVVSNTLTCLQQHAYIYRYDKRGNLKYKKLPGCEPIYYVYDKGDRLIFTQNGEQRTRGEWSFTFPDAFGRVVLEGTCTASLNYNNNPLTETVVNATRTNATDANKGYTISGISVTNMQIHRVNYYDNYAFIGQNSVPTTLSYTTPDTGYGTRYENHYKGLLTGSIIARWENGAVSGYDYAAYYYDQQGNVVQEKRTNHLGGLETYQHAYDRLGNPLKKKHVHTASGKTTRTEELAYTYDSGARPTKVTHKLNSGSTVTLAEYTYDEFCRMATKTVNENVSGSKTLYAYNLHGWLVDIHHPYMRLELAYNNGTTGFNGNITKMICSLPYGLSQNYSFTYDGLNRMLSADYSEGYSMNQNLDRYTEKVTEYDKNGNIKKLQRYGQTGASSYGLVDNLTYTYNGNKLTRVDDAVTATSYTGGTNFINGANTSNEYTYDANGNLTKDSNKGIANITYNLLSLPQVVTFSDGSTIRYMYSADGTKLKTTHVINGTTTTTDYCGNVIYENGTAKKLLIDGGYVDLTTTTPTYYYFLTDHQGNNRAVISAVGSSVLETNHYYPFGGLFSTSTNVQPYKYNGKELDTKGGLNLYDYGARHYDAALGRFTTIDPLGELNYGQSSFAYCGNNPINRIDPTGMLASPIYDDEGNLLGTDDEGLQGDAIVMDKDDFKQGMSHDDAKEKDKGTDSFKDDNAKQKFKKSYDSLKDRPDWDGKLTLAEANDWYRNGNGQPLFIDASQINLSPLSIEDLMINEGITFNFLYPTHLNLETGLVYGNIRITLLSNDGKVRIGNANNLIDEYNFDNHVNGNGFRNFATKIGEYVAGNGTSYKIYGHGFGKINHRINRPFGSRRWFY